MVRKGFKMKLYPGMEAEYEKRHNELWPEMPWRQTLTTVLFPQIYMKYSIWIEI